MKSVLLMKETPISLKINRMKDSFTSLKVNEGPRAKTQSAGLPAGVSKNRLLKTVKQER